MSNTMSVQEYLAMQGSSKKKGSPEHDEQVKVFEWASVVSNKIPELKLLFAIPNGAFYGGHWSVANRMKAEGVKKGVPDIFLPMPMTYVSEGQVTDLNGSQLLKVPYSNYKVLDNGWRWV